MTALSQNTQQVRTELITSEPSEALANLLGTDIPSDELLPLWHWVHLPEKRPQADLGPGGHPTFGIPAPPGPGRKRMFAGGRVSTHALLMFGEPATRTTWVADTRENRGRTGPLTFVTVRNEYTQGGRLCIVDENDILYRRPGFSLAIQAGTLRDQPAPSPRQPALNAHCRRSPSLPILCADLKRSPHPRRPQLGAPGGLQRPHRARPAAGADDERADPPLCDALVGKELAYRVVSLMNGPQSFTVLAGAAGVSAGVEVRDVHATTTALSDVTSIGHR